MTHTSNAHLAAEILRKLRPDFKPKLAIVLGSGLGDFAKCLLEKTVIPYQELPGFPHVNVQGHAGQLILGVLNGVPLVCLQGRSHFYEGGQFDAVKTYVRTMKLLGCEYFLATNASGSLREEVGPGELMLITDHINFQGTNPLIGPNDDAFGPRFPPLDHAYDPTMREILLSIAKKEQIPLHQGVYLAATGPNYETAAEIRAFRILGADAVGMSTVPEVLVACHCGLRSAVIAIITNFATGIAKTSHSHDAVVKMAASASEKLVRIIQHFVGTL